MRHIGSSIETLKKILALVQYLLLKAASLQCQNEKPLYNHQYFFFTELVAMDSEIAPLGVGAQQ